MNDKIAEEINRVIENELLRELTSELTLPLIDPDEVTATMLAQAMGINSQGAKRLLDRKLKKGELTSRQVKVENGKTATAYRKKT